MTLLTKDQQELVSLLRQIGHELSPSTYTDMYGLIGFDFSVWVVYFKPLR